MEGLSPLAIGLASGSILVGLVSISVLVVLASYLVKEFTHSHVALDEDEFAWGIPVGVTEQAVPLQRPLSIQTDDMKHLQGEFWAQPHPAPTIILCHGYRVPRQYLQPVATMEYQSGYNVLLFDFRGHGQSERAITGGGTAEVHDLVAAVATARQQPEALPGKLILHGFSMGAAVALLLPPQPDIVAIIADSPYARLDAILQRLVHFRFTTGSISWPLCFQWLRSAIPALAWVIVAISRLLFRLRFGYVLIARPDRSFKRWQGPSLAALHLHPTPILLIHSTDDPIIPVSHSVQLAAQAKIYHVPIETYFVAHANHCGAYGSNPRRYTTHLQRFIALHLGNDLPLSSSNV
ncbi:MAG: alpha/beta fold hydrolase [Ktedonobacteraceae bacterium]